MLRMGNIGLAVMSVLATSLIMVAAAGAHKETKKHQIASLTTTKITSPEAGIGFECRVLHGKSTSSNGYFNTGMKTCKVIGVAACKVNSPRFFVGVQEPEPGVAKFNIVKATAVIFHVTKCSQEGAYEVVGKIYGETKGAGGDELVLPEAPLPLSEATVNGKPAGWSGTYKLTGAIE